MTGKEIRDRSRRVVFDAYVTAKTTTDQQYRPYTRRMVKADKIWEDARQRKKDNTEFVFRPNAANIPEEATNSNLFVFGKIRHNLPQPKYLKHQENKSANRQTREERTQAEDSPTRELEEKKEGQNTNVNVDKQN